jgi:hypothetical protein
MSLIVHHATNLKKDAAMKWHIGCTAAIMLASTSVNALAQTCELKSGVLKNPVIELYTSEGCSSCPPADRWLSEFSKDSQSTAVVMAFHVSYWDYIGWVDRFATPVFNQRQRDVAKQNGLSSVYTPQVIRDGKDWPRWYSSKPASISATDKRGTEPALATITLQRNSQGVFEANVQPLDSRESWRAFWTITEDGHFTKVKAGENRGEQLRHDYVVRQYEAVAAQTGKARLVLKPLAAEATHKQRVNLVVTEVKTGKVLQALSLKCG